MKKIWNIIAGINTTFVLLTLIALLLLAGVLYTNAYFEFFASLDFSSIPGWLYNHFLTHFHLIWWISGLCISIPALMGNMLLCTVDKSVTVIKNKHLFSKKQLIGKYCIAAVHLISILVIGSHFISDQFSTIKTFPVQKKGDIIQVDNNAILYVTNIQYTYFPKHSLLKNYIKNISVQLSDENGIQYMVHSLSPLPYNDHTLLLIQKNQKKSKKERTNNINISTPQGSPQLHLLVKKDYGYTLWRFSFFCIIVLMSFFYIML
ncbi:MAG: hypothetical protein WHV26_00475 [Spirochaetota bacterium]